MKYIKDLNVQNEKTRYEQKLKTLNDQLKIDLEKIERINKIPKDKMEKNTIAKMVKYSKRSKN